MFDTSGADNNGFPTGTDMPSFYPSDQLSGGYGNDQLAILNGEKSFYNDPADQASLNREISRAQSSIDKPSSSTDVGQSSGAGTVGSGNKDWTSLSGILNNLGGMSDNTDMSLGKYLTSTPDQKSQYQSGLLDTLKKSLSSILAVVVGFVLLIGAFMIYRKN